MKDFFYSDFINFGFFSIRLIDLIDFGLVAFIVLQLYKLFKSSLAFNILLGILIYVITWVLVQVLDMQLLSSIMGYFVSVGALALLIVFQQEVRKFLLLIAKNTVLDESQSLRMMWPWREKRPLEVKLFKFIIEACQELSEKRVGALIVLSNSSELNFVVSAGERIDSRVSKLLLISIFQKSGPLHDGAVLISGNRIKLAGAVLPVSENPNLSPILGLRHRAAIGISEQSDAIVIVVSEETGNISLVKEGQLLSNLSGKEMLDILEKELSVRRKKKSAKH